jgi:hypothetical protein
MAIQGEASSPSFQQIVQALIGVAADNIVALGMGGTDQEGPHRATVNGQVRSPSQLLLLVWQDRQDHHTHGRWIIPKLDI